MVTLTIRLYRRHDIDLISLYKNPDFNFKKACLLALRGYVSNKPVYFKQPEFKGVKEYKFCYQLLLKLDEVRDKEIIDYLKKLQPRMQNAFVKMVMRGAVIGPVCYDCFIDDADGRVNRNIDTNNISFTEIPKNTRAKRKESSGKQKEDDKPVYNKEETIGKVIPGKSDTPEIADTIEQPSKSFSRIKPKDKVGVERKKENDAATLVNDTSNDAEDDFDMFGSLDNMFASF